jgi:hypothetical protein
MPEILLRSPEFIEGASLSLLNADYTASCEEENQSPITDEYVRDPVYVAHLCPMKMQRSGCCFLKTEYSKPTDEVIFEKLGTIIELQRLITQVSFELHRDYFVFTSDEFFQVFPTDQVNQIWPRKRKCSAVEFIFETGDSILFDFLNIDVSTLIKTFKRANFEKCTIWPTTDLFSTLGVEDKWISCQISNFEYIISLNLLAGRSFRDPEEYPFFPTFLTDFDHFSSFLPARIASSGCSPIVDPFAPIREAFSNPIIPADFFFRIEQIDEVPSWASSAADFVDRMRGLLESPRVTVGLHKWITTHFGPNGRASNGRLFDSKSHRP